MMSFAPVLGDRPGIGMDGGGRLGWPCGDPVRGQAIEELLPGQHPAEAPAAAGAGESAGSVGLVA
jgi:hypothetical protein